MATKVKYTIELLNSSINRDNATIIENYEKLNRDTNIEFICNCGNKYNKRFRCIYEVGAKCNKCTNTDKQKKRKQTSLNIYGVEHALQAKEFKLKAKQTCLQKYGVEHALQAKEFKLKAKQTMVDRYGVEHALQSKELKQKANDTIIERFGVENISQLPEIRDKVKQTNLKKFGVEYTMMNKDVKEKAYKTMMERYNVKVPLQNKIIRENIKNTTIERYGVEHALQSDEIKNKAKQTILKKYGVEYASQSEIFKEKVKQTCLEKYNVEHPSQCQEIHDKQQKNGKKFKEYIMPSGELRKVQGYEPLALNELVKTYEEFDIITKRKDIPRISYKLADKQKYYFPDIYIKSQNKIIEVKSTWTYKCKESNIEEKANATKSAGYDYEIWIYDDKGNKTIK